MIESSGGGVRSHLAQDELAAAELDVAQQAHLDRCVQCRTERKVRAAARVPPPSRIEAAPLSSALPPSVGSRERPSNEGRPPLMHPLPRLPAGRFTDAKWLGTGAWGVVYAALDPERGERVAVKILAREGRRPVELFKREFRRLADLHHRNLATLLELEQVDGLWLLVMELIDGVDLRSWLRGDPSSQELLPGRSPRATERVVPTFGQLLTGLDFLHRSGHLHRDLKPANVLVEPDGRVVLVDFGLVSQRARALAELGGVVGTHQYIAPELYAGGAASPASDLFAVGVLLHQALTGRLPARPSTAVVLPSPDLPKDDLAELCRALLCSDPAGRPSGGEARRLLHAHRGPHGARPRPDALPSAPADLFLGRGDELRRLHEYVEATSGGLVTVELLGPSGAGKTALIERFVAAHRGRERRAFTARCHLRDNTPYQGLDEIVAGLLADSGAALGEAARGRVARITTGGGPAVGADDGLTDPVRERVQLVEDLAALVAAAASAGPLLLSVDDTQWGDVDGAAIIGALLPAIAELPVLLLLSHRTAADSAPMVAALDEYEGQLGDRRGQLHLGPLRISEARQLATATLAARSAAATPALVEWIIDAAGGSPLLITELSRWATPSGLARTPDGDRAPLLKQLINARLADLPEGARRLLEVAAVAGGPLAEGLLSEAADDAPALLVAALRRHHLLRVEPGPRGRRLEPWHAQVRDAVLAGLSSEGLASHSLRLAQVLERRGEPSTALAHQFAAGGDEERALYHARRGAADAVQALAFDQAGDLWQLATTLLQGQPEELVEAHTGLARARALGGRCQEAAEAHLEAAHHCDGPVRQQALIDGADQLVRAGQLERAETLLTEIVVPLGGRIPGDAHAALGKLLWRRTALRVRGLRFRERPAADADPRALALIDALTAAARCLAIATPIRSAAVQVQALRLALRVGELRRVATGMAAEACLSAARGLPTLKRTDRFIAAAAEVAERAEDVEVHSTVALARGLRHYMTGEMRPAAEALMEMERILEGHPGSTWNFTTGRIFLQLALLYLGELRVLGARFDACFAEGRARGDIWATANLTTGGAGYIGLLVQDRPQGALALIQGQMKLWAGQGFRSKHPLDLMPRCQIALYQGHPWDAWRELEIAWPLLQNAMVFHMHFVAMHLHFLRARAGIALLREGQPPQGTARIVRRDLKDLRGRKIRNAVALSLSVEAALQELDGEDATDLWAHAAALFDELEQSLLAAAARWRAAELSPGRFDPGAQEQLYRAQGVTNPRRLAGMLLPIG